MEMSEGSFKGNIAIAMMHGGGVFTPSRIIGLDVGSETGGRLIPCRAQKLEN